MLAFLAALCLATEQHEEFDRLMAQFSDLGDSLKGALGKIEEEQTKLAQVTETVKKLADDLTTLRKQVEETRKKTDGATAQGDKKVDEAIRAEAAATAKDTGAIPITLVAVKTPEFQKDISGGDKFMYSNFKNWQCKGIPKEAGSDVWMFKGRDGEFLFRAEKVSRAVKIVVPPFSFKHCNVRKFKLQFILNDKVVHETQQFQVGARVPRPLTFPLKEAVWFRDVKFIASSGADDICFPDFELFDDAVAQTNTEL